MKLLSLLSNFFMAVVSFVNPILGFFASVVKYVTSETKSAGVNFFVEVVSQILPGGFIKDVALGVVYDIIEAGSLSEAIDETVPYNDVVLKCDRCANYSHYFIKHEHDIVCKKCFEKSVDKEITYLDKIYVKRGGLYQLKNEIREKNMNIIKPSDLNIVPPKDINFKN